MKIGLYPTREPVRVKKRINPTDKQNLFDKYFTELTKLGIIKPFPQVTSQAAPCLVPKNSKSLFRTTIESLSVNAGTNSEPWPMLMIEAESCDCTDSKHFVSMELVADYWQCPQDSNSYNACGVVAPQGTFISTQALHELKKVPPIFNQQ